MKIALCFRFAQTFLTKQAESRGNFFKLQGKIQRFKKHRARIHRGYFFTTVQNSYSVPCWGKPQTPKARAKNGTRFARVFSKAKAHSS